MFDYQIHAIKKSTQTQHTIKIIYNKQFTTHNKNNIQHNTQSKQNNTQQTTHNTQQTTHNIQQTTHNSQHTTQKSQPQHTTTTHNHNTQQQLTTTTHKICSLKCHTLLTIEMINHIPRQARNHQMDLPQYVLC